MTIKLHSQTDPILLSIESQIRSALTCQGIFSKTTLKTYCHQTSPNYWSVFITGTSIIGSLNNQGTEATVLCEKIDAPNTTYKFLVFLNGSRIFSGNNLEDALETLTGQIMRNPLSNNKLPKRSF